MDCAEQIMTMNTFIYTYAHVQIFLFVDKMLSKKQKGKLHSYLHPALAKFTTFRCRSNEHWLCKYSGKFVLEGLFVALAESPALEEEGRCFAQCWTPGTHLVSVREPRLLHLVSQQGSCSVSPRQTGIKFAQYVTCWAAERGRCHLTITTWPHLH